MKLINNTCDPGACTEQLENTVEFETQSQLGSQSRLLQMCRVVHWDPAILSKCPADDRSWAVLEVVALGTSMSAVGGSFAAGLILAGASIPVATSVGVTAGIAVGIFDSGISSTNKQRMIRDLVELQDPSLLTQQKKNSVAKVFRYFLAISTSGLASMLIVTGAFDSAIQAHFDRKDASLRSSILESIIPTINQEEGHLIARSNEERNNSKNRNEREERLVRRIELNNQLAGEASRSALCESAGKSGGEFCPTGLTQKRNKNGTPGPMEVYYRGEEKRVRSLIEQDTITLAELRKNGDHLASTQKLSEWRLNRSSLEKRLIDEDPHWKPISRDLPSRVTAALSLGDQSYISLILIILVKFSIFSLDVGFLMLTHSRHAGDYEERKAQELGLLSQKRRIIAVRNRIILNKYESDSTDIEEKILNNKSFGEDLRRKFKH